MDEVARVFKLIGLIVHYTVISDDIKKAERFAFNFVEALQEILDEAIPVPKAWELDFQRMMGADN